MAKIARKVSRFKELSMYPSLSKRVTALEEYNKNLDQLLVVFDKHFPAVMAEAFGGPEVAQTGGGGGVDEGLPAVALPPTGGGGGGIE